MPIPGNLFFKIQHPPTPPEAFFNECAFMLPVCLKRILHSLQFHSAIYLKDTS